MTSNSITTIDWIELPSNGNGGAAIVYWRASTLDTTTYRTLRPRRDQVNQSNISYLLGDKPPRYPLPVTTDNALTACWHMLPCKCSMCISDWICHRAIEWDDSGPIYFNG